MVHLFRSPLLRGLIALIFWVLLIDAYVPPEFGYENGVIENIQVAVLLVGACVSIAKVRTSEDRTRCLWIAGALFLLLMAGREISWGRVFFPPMENGNSPPVKALPYGPIVYPLVGVTIVSIIILIIRGRLVNYLRTYGIPMVPLILLLAAVYLSYDAEHLHLLPLTNGQVVEEFCELVVYSLFTWMVARMKSS